MMYLTGTFTIAAGSYLGFIVIDATFAPTLERVFTGLLALTIVYMGGCMVAAGRSK